VRIPGDHRTEASGEPRNNCGVTIEDVGPEDEPVLVGSRTDPSNIKYQNLIIDDEIVKTKNYENYADVVKSGKNESCLASDKFESLKSLKN